MSYNLLAKSISTSNHMFGRAIWDKLPKCIFESYGKNGKAHAKKQIMACDQYWQVR